MYMYIQGTVIKMLMLDKCTYDVELHCTTLKGNREEVGVSLIGASYPGRFFERY